MRLACDPLQALDQACCIALDVPQQGKTSAPFAEQCRAVWTSAAAALGPGRDHTEIARLVEQLAEDELG